MTEEQCDSYSNVILLCRDDHRLIDGKHRAKYPVKLLLEWKAKREGAYRPALARLGAVSEERFEELITNPMKQRVDRILIAIEELRQSDQEAAQLLTSLLDEVHELPRSGSIVDPDTAALLAQAGASLQHIDADLPVQLLHR